MRLATVTVTRIKGAGQGTQLVVRIEKLEIDGKDNYGCPRTGAVMLKDNQASTPSMSTTPKYREHDLHPDDAAVLMLLSDKPGLSFAGIAETLNWVDGKRQPDRSRPQRSTTRLSNLGLVTIGDDGHYSLTEAGRAQAQKIRARDANASPASSPHSSASLAR